MLPTCVVVAVFGVGCVRQYHRVQCHGECLIPFQRQVHAVETDDCVFKHLCMCRRSQVTSGVELGVRAPPVHPEIRRARVEIHLRNPLEHSPSTTPAPIFPVLPW